MLIKPVGSDLTAFERLHSDNTRIRGVGFSGGFTQTETVANDSSRDAKIWRGLAHVCLTAAGRGNTENIQIYVPLAVVRLSDKGCTLFVLGTKGHQASAYG